jgi:Tfp pilus assembly protein PilO
MEFTNEISRNLGLVSTHILEKNMKTTSLPKKYLNYNFFIFIGFLIILGYTLWYKYNQKQKKISETKIKQEELDLEYQKAMETAIREEEKQLEIREDKQDEYIDLDGWASLSF